MTEAYNGIKKLTEGIKKALEKIKKDCSFFDRKNIESANMYFLAFLTMMLKKNRKAAKDDFLSLIQEAKNYFWLKK